MGKSSAPSAPAPPDPYATAAAQTQGDVQSAIANAYIGNSNVNSPYGSSTFQQTGTRQITDAQGRPIDVPTFTQNISLSPQQQTLLNQQNQLGQSLNQLGINQVGRVSSLLSQPISTSGLPQIQSSVSNPTFSQPVSAPSLQTSFNPGQNVQGNVNLTNAQTTFGASGPIQGSVGPNDFSADRRRVEEALYSRINPQLEHDRLGLENRLQNQGITQGSEAWNQAIDSSNRAATDARNQAIAAGGQEQSRLFGLDLSKGQFANSAQQQGFDQAQNRGLFALNATNQNNQNALASGQFANQAAAQQYGQNQGAAAFGNQAAQQNFGNQQSVVDTRNNLAQQGFANQLQGATFNNQAAQQALQQQLALRNQPLNEITALMGGGQVSMPQFAGYNAPQIGPSTIGSNIYNNANLANQQYMAQTQFAGQNNAGLYGLGGAALGAGGRLGAAAIFSDIRLKRDDFVIGSHNGLPLHAFRYVWDDDDEPLRVGYIAQEVEQVFPEAVFDVGGFKAVDYAQVM